MRRSGRASPKILAADSASTSNRFRVATLLILVAYACAGLGMWSEHQRAKVRWRQHLQKIGARDYRERMLGPFGVAVLTNPDRCERLNLASNGVATPTGQLVPIEEARGIAARLLDLESGRFVPSENFPAPEAGLRFSRGSDQVDVLYQLQHGHVDLWFQVQCVTGVTPAETGPRGWDDPDLRAALGRLNH